MSGLELNKIAASILLASIIAMFTGVIANALYRPVLKPDVRGYEIALSEDERESSDVTTQEFKPDIKQLMKNANAEAGKQMIKKCLSCHSVNHGGPNKVGPNLWNVVGAEKGHVNGYKYSAALKAKGGIWDEESLFHFLHKPNKFIPKTKMSFLGIKKPEDIADIIMFLKTLTNK